MNKTRSAYQGTHGSASVFQGTIKPGAAKDFDSFVLAEIPKGVVLTRAVLRTTQLGVGSGISFILRDYEGHETSISEEIATSDYSGEVVFDTDPKLGVLVEMDHNKDYLLLIHIIGVDVDDTAVFNYRIETASLGIS